MKLVSALAICLLGSFASKAQLAYNFAASTAAYTPLTGATAANAGKLWDTDTDFALPLGFSFRMNGVTTQTMYMNGSFMHPTANAAKHNGFILIGTGIIDRGTPDGVSKSPVRYTTTGAAGSRIFKMEFMNAGFEDELDGGSSDLKDSLNLQVWLYEGSNVVEYRFGGSRVSDFSTYFSGKMQTGFVRNLDTATATFDKFFFLNGAPASPTLDSTLVFQFTRGLSAFPANGQVYRFTPKAGTTAVERVAANTLASVYPTRTQHTVQIRNTANTVLQAELYGIDGRMIRRSEARPGGSEIALDQLPAGMYLLRLTDTERGLSETQRIEKL